MKTKVTRLMLVLVCAFSFTAVNVTAQEKNTKKSATEQSFDKSGQAATPASNAPLLMEAPSKLACDTLNLSLYRSSWTLTDYSVTATPQYSSGFVNGVNTYGDKMKANYFANTGGNTRILGGWIALSKAFSTTPTKTVTVNVWSVVGGNPGAVLASKTLTMAELMTDVAGNYFTSVVFDNPVNIAGAPFFMGIDYTNLNWATSHDTLSIQSNVNAETSPSQVWEYQSTNVWAQYTTAGSWNLAISLAIFPVMSNVLADASFTQSATSTCTGYPVTLNGSASVQSAVYWELAGATPTTSSAVSPVVTYATPGTYPIKLYVAGGSCNNLDSMITSITIVASPLPNATATPTAVCKGQSTTLSAANGISYQWNGYSAVPVPDQVVFPTASGSYVVTVTAANSCSASQSVAVTVYELPLANASASPLEVCEGQGTLISAEPGMTSYSWTPGGQMAASFWDYPNVPTTYIVTVIDGNECQGIDTVSVTIGLCTGIDESSSDNGFSVYPNPAEGSVNIHFTQTSAGTEFFEIYAMDGRLLATQQISRSTADFVQTIDLSAYAAGVYYLQLHAYNQSFVQKLVIR